MFHDHLRPPSVFDPQAPAYKDWLHLILFDHASGNIGLINVSLHGAPGNPRSRAVGIALLHVPSLGWIGSLEVRGLHEAAISSAGIGLARVAIAVDDASDRLSASVRDPQNGLNIDLTAKVAAPSMVVEQQLPLGHGWISWLVVPRLIVSGEWTIGHEKRDLSSTSAYHDHNWGRWYWGDDIGWEWGCFLTPATSASASIPFPSGDAMPSSIALVFSRPTDRAHRQNGQLSLSVFAGNKRRTFSGPAIKLSYEGKLDSLECRVPGALAALHQDRIHAHLPEKIKIQADDGRDQAMVEFTGRSAAQLIAADPMVRGYGFIHEIAGGFTCEGHLGDQEISSAGLGVFEYVC